ncbi:MAG: transposase [Kiritimatiellae bacterium]|nr:transposase [Kiritimatiellia bacterium]
MWDECRTSFAQGRTAQRARRLGLSQLACLGRHTISGLLCASGRQFVDWSADYRLFARDVWQAQRLFEPIVRGVLGGLPPGAPFVTALDDTHLPKSGTHTPGVAYRRDPLSPPFHTNLIRAQRFQQVSALLPYEWPAGAARAIPIRYQHVPPVPKPKRNAGDEVWRAYRQRQRHENLSTAAVQAVTQLRRALDQPHGAAERVLVVGVDGSYTNQTVLRGLPARTTLIGRIRKDAKFFAPPRAAEQPAVGSKRHYGVALPTPEQVRQDETIPWQEVPAFGAGKRHTFRVKTLARVLWKKAGPAVPLRLVVVAPVAYRPRQGSKLLYRQPAYLICTDPALALAQLLQYYLWRWDIEVNHRDEKQIIGVGQAQVRAPRSVARQPALAVASYAMLLLAAARVYGAQTPRGRLPLPKWYHPAAEQRLSTAELVRQLRSEVWAHALQRLNPNSADFVTGSPPAPKSPESTLPAAAALLYASAG